MGLAAVGRPLPISVSMAHPYLLRRGPTLALPFMVLEGICLFSTPTAVTCTTQWYRQRIRHTTDHLHRTHHIMRRTKGHRRTHRCMACTLWAAQLTYRSME